MCGGTGVKMPSGWFTPGLSPRVRGNPTARCTPAPAPGSIPACAGEPRFGRRRRRPAGVYPRVCGGTNGLPPLTMLAQGLSPRVRGNHKAGRRRQRRPRSIPACAGNPSSGATAQGRMGSIPACAGEPSRIMANASAVRVYPRVCGGTAANRTSGVKSAGLSPRVRGNLGVVVAPVIGGGSIPACAGEP